MCVWQCIPPNGYLNELSDEQPWTSWGALFSDPDISALLWISNSMPPQVKSRHMPCASLHAAAPSQCLIISIILIIIIIRFAIQIFRHPFSKNPTVRWKWQVRASIGTAKKDIGICANIDRVFFSPARCVCLIMYTSKLLFRWTKWWATMDIVGCSFFGSRYLRSALNVQFHVPAPNELSSYALRVSSRNSPLAVFHHHQYYRHHPHHHHHHHHHSTCDSDFSTSICHVI